MKRSHLILFTVLKMNELNLKSVLNPYFLLVFSALLFSTLTDQFLQKRIELIIGSRDGLTAMVWVWGGLSVLSAIIFPLLISLLCAFVLVSTTDKARTIGTFLGENIELSLIETLRAWGKIFLWSFVFFFPGIVKYINYILTPFVVLFSRKYKNGEVDALEYSAKISKFFWWRIKLWLGVFYVLVPIVMYALFDEYSVFATHPFSATMVVFFETLIQMVFHAVILKLFIKFLNEVEYATPV